MTPDKETMLKWNRTIDQWIDSYISLDKENEQLRQERDAAEQERDTAKYQAERDINSAQREVGVMQSRLYDRTTAPVLWKKYRLGDCPLALERVIEEIPLATEVVIKKGQWVEPQKARIYSTDWYWHEGKIVSYDFIRTLPGFKGSGDFDSVIVIEEWEDRGDDGHIDNNPCGLVIASDNEWRRFKEIEKKTRHYNALYLLDMMIRDGKISDYVEEEIKKIGRTSNG